MKEKISESVLIWVICGFTFLYLAVAMQSGIFADDQHREAQPQGF
jgi:hypothetical protein